MYRWTNFDPKESLLTEVIEDDIKIKFSSSNLIKISILDLETNGLDYKSDPIFEIGIQQYTIDRERGYFVSLDKEYYGLQDIDVKLKRKVKNLTKITKEELVGKEIDWQIVADLISESDYVFAHNAKFDRNFLEKNVPESSLKKWGCSCIQISWIKKGFSSAGLEHLLTCHGKYYDGHRVKIDVTSTAWLLQQKDPTNDDKPYIVELLSNIDNPLTILIADKYPKEKKDSLRDLDFFWSPAGFYHKIVVNKDQVEEDLELMHQSIYNSEINLGYAVKIDPLDSFKDFEIIIPKYRKQFISLKKYNKPIILKVKTTAQYKDQIKDHSTEYKWNPETFSWDFFGTEEEVLKEIEWLKNSYFNKVVPTKLMDAKKLGWKKEINPLFE